MLVAPMLPMSLSPSKLSSTPTRRQRSRSVSATSPQLRHAILIGWFVLGSLAVACVPALRGGLSTGWTLPFWLIAAPLVNLAAMAWLRRIDARRARQR